ncbi:hypothetical protein ACH5A3_44145 [Streptomyces echinatus]|uniref:hypothetical protein n=1 Tax=Streptomyces echinatus TaxID=67293 RepID=UPI00379477BA
MRSCEALEVTGWILTHPDTQPESEHLKLKTVLADCPELNVLAGHVRAFGKMLTQLQGDQLPQWIQAVRADDLPSLHTVVNGLERDLAAVTAGLTLPWNSGIYRRPRQSSARCTAGLASRLAPAGAAGRVVRPALHTTPGADRADGRLLRMPAEQRPRTAQAAARTCGRPAAFIAWCCSGRAGKGCAMPRTIWSGAISLAWSLL